MLLGELVQTMDGKWITHPPKRRRCLTKQDKSAPKFSDLLRRDFAAAAPNRKWCGDVTEIGSDEGKLYL